MEAHASDRRKLIESLWPLNRTLANSGTDQALEIVSKEISLQIESVPTGTRVFTWEVPPRWSVDRGLLKTEDGQTLADFQKHPLYLASYSDSFEGWVDRETLRSHLTVSQLMPDAIPFTFKFYERVWHMSLEYNRWQEVQNQNKFFVDIKTRFESGHLNFGIKTLPGRSKSILLLVANICHPFIANDSISGLACLVGVVKKLEKMKLNHTIRLLICPETIGSLCYLHNHVDEIENHKAAIFSEMVGIQKPLRLLQSLQAQTEIDRAARVALKESGVPQEVHDFMDGPSNDEKVLNSPGFDIPSISFVRWPYNEYHTSADTPSILDDKRMDEAEDVILKTILNFDRNFVPKRKFRGLLGLSANGLYQDWRDNIPFCRAMYKLLMSLDNKTSILEMCENTGLPFDDVHLFCQRLLEKGLCERGDQA